MADFVSRFLFYIDLGLGVSYISSGVHFSLLSPLFNLKTTFLGFFLYLSCTSELIILIIFWIHLLLFCYFAFTEL